MLCSFKRRYRFFVWLLLLAFPAYCMPQPLFPRSLRIMLSMSEAAAEEITPDEGLPNVDPIEETESYPPPPR